MWIHIVLGVCGNITGNVNKVCINTNVIGFQKYYNNSQVEVIGAVADAVLEPYTMAKICLVQGPPGTGKSHTIIGLIKRILNGVSAQSTHTC